MSENSSQVSEPNASVLAKFRDRGDDGSERLKKLEQRKALAAQTNVLLNARERELKRVEGVKRATEARRKSKEEAS